MGEIITPRTRNIWIRLAGEGVPISAIGRAFKTEFSEIEKVLAEAQGKGDLAALPLPDWKPNSDRSEGAHRPPQMRLSSRDERMIAVNRLSQRLSITAMQAEIAYVIATSPDAIPRDAVLRRLVRHTGHVDDPYVNIISVQVARLRPVLLRIGVRIDTIHGFGYSMPEACRMIILRIAAGETDGKGLV